MKAKATGEPLRHPKAHQVDLDQRRTSEAREIISSSKRPLILAGPGAGEGRSGGVPAEAGPLLGHTGGAHLAWGRRLPYDDELSLNTVGLRAKDRVRKMFEQMDAVLLVGFDVPEFQPGFWNIGIPKKVVGLVAAPLEAVPG